MKEPLSLGGILTDVIEYEIDDDGIIVISQVGNEITLTPRQALDTMSLLQSYLDVIGYLKYTKE